MADATKPKAVSDWINKPYAAYVAATEKRRELFDAFNKFVTEQGGWGCIATGRKAHSHRGTGKFIAADPARRARHSAKLHRHRDAKHRCWRRAG